MILECPFIFKSEGLKDLIVSLLCMSEACCLAGISIGGEAGQRHLPGDSLTGY